MECTFLHRCRIQLGSVMNKTTCLPQLVSFVSALIAVNFFLLGERIHMTNVWLWEVSSLLTATTYRYNNQRRKLAS